TRRDTLTDHLEWQLQLTELPIDEEVAARFIIGNLDERGYLQATIGEIARQSGMSEATVESALLRVQDLDPVGVGARDLKECLLIQVRVLEIDDPLVLRILEACLDALIKRDFRGVARALDVSVTEVVAAAEIIGHLEPRPGRAFGGDEPVYIVPDIYVHKVNEDFHIVLNDDGMPRLRINGLYRDVLSRGNGASKDTREYVQEKVRSALWLIKSIHQRQRTIYRVMESIIKYQREFFERGINHLKPLNLRDVADDIEMHESTVSRVTTAKYVNTPQGIFELKYFFNSSINRFVGDAVASESVKERIRKLITAEDPRRPLSDQRIAEMLKVANIDIARRTVTKYRESLNILSSTKRREVG
ncbi:MAG TPA: RNA polymerase factor sigma-54, partial [Myxococcota bacterium]